VPDFLRDFRGRGWMGHKNAARSFVMKMRKKWEIDAISGIETAS
jgi:hypothetical protein